MKDTEVEGFEGVERGLMGLLRLWKCVEKSNCPRLKPTRGPFWFAFALIIPAAWLALVQSAPNGKLIRPASSTSRKQG